MEKVIRYVRMDEWLASKITMMLGILAYFIYDASMSVVQIIVTVACYFTFLFMFLAVSYVSNDFADIDVDKAVGKAKVIADLPKWVVWLSLIGMILMGTIPIICYSNNKKMCFVLIIITYVLGISYSAPGIRLKERGIWGLLECSFAQRCMPLMMIICLIELDLYKKLFLIAWMLLSFMDGIRYIIIHQIIDIDNDKKSGVETYVLRQKKNYRNIIKILLASEVVIGIVAMLPMLMKEPIVMFAGIIVSIVLEYCIYIVLCKYAQKDWLVSFDSVPLEAYWNMIMPFSVGLCLLEESIVLILFPLFLFLVCRKPLLVKCNIARIYIKKTK